MTASAVSIRHRAGKPAPGLEDDLERGQAGDAGLVERRRHLADVEADLAAEAGRPLGQPPPPPRGQPPRPPAPPAPRPRGDPPPRSPPGTRAARAPHPGAPPP